LFFSVHDATAGGAQLWKSDGTAAGTVLIATFQPFDGEDISAYPVFSGSTLFVAVQHGYEYDEDWPFSDQLWKCDGTAAGTVLLQDVGGDYLSNLTNVNGMLFFVADDGAHG